ncbi:MAG: Carboxy-terminal processing protease CtpA precursor [Syntrophaceae bacterium PtaU1.Bin231]|nr:MAG: Carboxy-terminal processing protease CtpA precursor [Syntrophaceae bacterium PtaB.Bin038]OPY86969.1 MAG: Carboxy-terminal processing protease CtpA precursor [Syntrophaceae bacterium PtaU1.Bin231]
MTRKGICNLLTAVILLTWGSLCLAEAVPEEARRYLMRGMAAEEMARAPGDFERAAREYGQAAKLAPTWPEIYVYLGSAQTKAGDYRGAMASFRRFLELAPDSPDAGKIRDELYKLEYLAEQQSKVAEIGGAYESARGTFTVTVSGADFSARWTGNATGVDVKFGGAFGAIDFRGKGISEEVFSGTMDGAAIKGTWRRAPYKDEKSDCTIPGDQSEFTGTVSEDGATIRLKFIRSRYNAEYTGVFFGLETCTGVNKTGEMPEEIVLFKPGKVKSTSAPDFMQFFYGKDLGLVGINLAEQDPRLVAGVVEGMPAAAAGIRAGDRLLKVNGKEVGGMNGAQIANLVRGKAGTKVTLEVERKGEAKPLRFELVRMAKP